jgi:hypothetical protein
MAPIFRLLPIVLFISCSPNLGRASPVIDCIVRSSGNSDVPLSRSYENERRIGSVKPGSLVYIQEYAFSPAAGKAEIYKFEAGDFKTIGFIKSDKLDCDGGGTTREYPIVIRSFNELRKAFGLFLLLQQTT